ncbi:MAG TPA: hypothetical protein EYQ50_26130 [Verrucomicrobiales bacterium]|nr:hypothetical protein [Verrucomicrobiales bacterium]
MEKVTFYISRDYKPTSPTSKSHSLLICLKLITPSCSDLWFSWSGLVSWGQVTFVFDYTGAGDFNVTSKASLQSAASTVSSWFNHTATINIAVSSSNADTSTLASAGSTYSNTFDEGKFTDRGVVGTKTLSNGATDPNGATADGTVDVNFFHTWDFDDSVASNALDFKSTMMHELLHAVGFSSQINQNGNSAFGDTPATASFWSLFDQFMADKDGSIISSGGVLDGTKWTTALTGGTGSAPLNLGLYAVVVTTLMITFLLAPVPY